MADGNRSLKDIALQFVSDFGGSALAEMLLRKPGGGHDRKTLHEVVEMFKGGKIEEAKKHIEEALGKRSLLDELTLSSDLLAVVRHNRLTRPQWNGLVAFLDALPEEVRTKFREAHVLEKEPTVRFANLTQLGLIPATQRVAFLRASGYFDPSNLQRLSDHATQQLPLLDARANQLKQQIGAVGTDSGSAKIRRAFGFRLFR